VTPPVPEMRAVLLPIQPRHVEAILAGRKTVELRKWRPSWPQGTHMLIYASAPVQRVACVAKSGAMLEAPPAELWRRVRRQAAVDRQLFDSYFAHSDQAFGIPLLDVVEVPKQELGFPAPQRFQYLRPDRADHARLLRLVEWYCPSVAN
jgi:predicted transcriptional regulator